MIQGTENLRLGDLIYRRVPFVVPKYQRGFAWDEEEIKDFVEDIQKLYDARLRDPSKPKSHFFGGLVSVDRPALGTTTGRIYDVVDGQQRLATFFLTISLLISGLEAVAEQAEAEDARETAQAARSHADTTKNDYLEYKEVVGSSVQARLRLRLSRADDVFFETLVNSGNVAPSRDSHRRLRNAQERISEGLIRPILAASKLAPSKRLENLLGLRTCVTEDCHLIHIVSDDRTEAYKLFAVLNDRGRTLSDGDLLRSYTLELLEGNPKHQDAVEKCWDHILGYSESEIDQFLRAYYPSHLGERAPKRDLAESFRKAFFNHPDPPLGLHGAKEIEARISSMQEESSIFSEISEGRWPYDESAVSSWERDRLGRLIKVLKHTLCLPLLMAAHKHLNEQKFAIVVNLLERFVFRYITMVGCHAGKLAAAYYKHAKELREKGPGYQLGELEAELRTLEVKNSPDDLFEVNFEQKLDYGQSAARLIIRHFLATLEDYMGWYEKGAKGLPTPDTTRVWDLNQITIEHIYPQNPPSPVPALEPQKHNIGNLTFWAPNDNQAAGNSPFSMKKARYDQSHVLLTRELAKLPDWTPEALAERRKRVVQIAKRVFTVGSVLARG